MVLLAECGRRQIAQSCLLANAVIEDFDVLDDFPPGLLTRVEAAMMYPLVFQRSLETLHRRVVPTIPLAAHGGTHAELLQLLLIGARAVLLQRSEWCFSPFAGRLAATARNSACDTKPVLIRSAMT